MQLAAFIFTRHIFKLNIKYVIKKIFSAGSPDNVPGVLVLHGRVDDGDYCEGGDVADVAVDEDPEVGDVDEGEVAAVQLSVGVRLMLLILH